jgi:hypothetical protein
MEYKLNVNEQTRRARAEQCHESILKPMSGPLSNIPTCQSRTMGLVTMLVGSDSLAGRCRRTTTCPFLSMLAQHKGPIVPHHRMSTTQ